MLSYRHLAVDYLNSVLDDYISLGLHDREFEKQILIRENYKYEQRLSEVLVFDYLRHNGFSISSQDYGPDFKAEKDGVTYWFEVITPEPSHQINDYIHSAERRINPCPDVMNLNDRHTLLKITGAVRNKNLVFQKYIDAGLIGENDICIIVINDTLLQPTDLPMYGLTEHHVKGHSSKPLIAEALLGLGHQVWQRNDEGNMTISNTTISNMDTMNNSPVSLDCFSNGGYENISAVLCMTLREDSGFCHSMGWLAAPHRACVVLNDRTNRKIEKRFINAIYMTKDSLIALCTPRESNVASVVCTIYKQKQDFMKYMHNMYPILKKNKYSIWDYFYNYRDDYSGV